MSFPEPGEGQGWIAPLDWAWGRFPLDAEGEETLLLEHVIQYTDALIAEARRLDDEALIGPIMHWAHILKTEQGPDGAWPSVVNARTGETIGAARTLAPATLMARLDALLDSSEYAACIARASHAILQGESNGRRDTDPFPGR